MDTLEIGETLQLPRTSPLWLAGGRLGTVVATRTAKGGQGALEALLRVTGRMQERRVWVAVEEVA